MYNKSNVKRSKSHGRGASPLSHGNAHSCWRPI